MQSTPTGEAATTVDAKIRTAPIGWEVVTFASALESLIALAAGLAAWAAHHAWALGAASIVLVFWLASVAATLLALRVIRAVNPLAPGVYSSRSTSAAFNAWVLQSFLSITNLSFLHVNGLVPPILRKSIYALMGANFAPGFVNISGRIHDPWMVSIGANAQVGDDTLILGHVVNCGVLIIAAVDIQPDVVIGVRSVIMPGVTVGRGSIVNAVSVVPMHTQIPAYEVWGGIPAVKLRDLPRPKPTEQA